MTMTPERLAEIKRDITNPLLMYSYAAELLAEVERLRAELAEVSADRDSAIRCGNIWATEANRRERLRAPPSADAMVAAAMLLDQLGIKPTPDDAVNHRRITDLAKFINQVQNCSQEVARTELAEQRTIADQYQETLANLHRPYWPLSIPQAVEAARAEGFAQGIETVAQWLSARWNELHRGYEAETDGKRRFALDIRAREVSIFEAHLRALRPTPPTEEAAAREHCLKPEACLFPGCACGYCAKKPTEGDPK